MASKAGRMGIFYFLLYSFHFLHRPTTTEIDSEVDQGSIRSSLREASVGEGVFGQTLQPGDHIFELFRKYFYGEKFVEGRVSGQTSRPVQLSRDFLPPKAGLA